MPPTLASGTAINVLLFVSKVKVNAGHALLSPVPDADVLYPAELTMITSPPAKSDLQIVNS